MHIKTLEPGTRERGIHSNVNGLILRPIKEWRLGTTPRPDQRVLMQQVVGLSINLLITPTGFQLFLQRNRLCENNSVCVCSSSASSTNRGDVSFVLVHY